MSTQDNTVSNSHDNSPVTSLTLGWDWPDESNLAHFAEQAAEADRMDEAAAPVEDNFEYAALYFGS